MTANDSSCLQVHIDSGKIVQYVGDDYGETKDVEASSLLPGKSSPPAASSPTSQPSSNGSKKSSPSNNAAAKKKKAAGKDGKSSSSSLGNKSQIKSKKTVDSNS